MQRGARIALDAQTKVSDEMRCDALIEATAQGDRRALSELFALEAGRMVAIARRILRRRELAEEAVQEAFVTVWQKAPHFSRARGAGRAWLTIIVRNRALNMLRDGGRMDLVDMETIAEIGARNDDADDAYRALAAQDELRRCLDLLPAERRRSIVMAYVVGFTHGEIAAKLSAPVGTVKAWIRRGVIALQECMS